MKTIILEKRDNEILIEEVHETTPIFAIDCNNKIVGIITMYEGGGYYINSGLSRKNYQICNSKKSLMLHFKDIYRFTIDINV